ncbi:MAG TPA: site-specific integrase [Rhizomicrobium sp.]
MLLTDPTIRALPAPDRGAVIFPDDLIPGFGVRVSEGGTRSFVLTHGPRRIRETLGRVGVISLKDARAEAKRRLAEYTLGRNKPRSVSWNDAKTEYLAELATRRKPCTHREYTRILNCYFRFGDTKLGELKPHDLKASLERLADTPAMRRYAFATVRAFLRWAHRQHYLDQSPMERMQAPRPSRPRTRILTDEEIVRVWNASGENTCGRIVRLLILTGQRRGEITRLTGAMVGTNTITFPAEHTKNGRQHTFPIDPMAKAILGVTPAPDTLYFPARGRTTPYDGFATGKAHLDKVCGFSDWTIHDLRRTFASGLASVGVQLPVIERLLNHVSGSFGGIVSVYQHYDFMTEMREAILRWENHTQVITSKYKLAS